MPMLPIVTINGKQFFVDERLRELRNVEDFSDSIHFTHKDEFRDCLYAIGAPQELYEHLI